MEHNFKQPLRCKSGLKVGIVQNRQRYKCKSCGYYYSVEKKSDVKSASTKRLALEMYLEGLGFRAIGRILRVSYVSVYNWIKAYGQTASALQSQEAISVVELDELHS